MSVQTILDDTNHIKPEYLQGGNYGFVKNPLESPLYCFNPAQAVAHPIVDASYVSAANIKTDQLDQLPGSLLNEIRVTTDLEMATAKRLKFQANGEITCVTTLTVDAPTATNFNGDIELYKTLPTIKLNDTSTPGLPGGTITYDTSQRLKFTSEQTTPFVAGGQITADGGIGRISLDSYADDGVAVRHMGVTADASLKTATIGGNGGGGFTGVSAECNPGSEAVATSVQGQEVLKVNPSGNVSVGGTGADGSLFLVKNGFGTYSGINTNSSDELTLFSGGGNIVANHPFKPTAGIVDDFSSTGSAGDVLVKNGSNQLYWGTLTGGWAGLALSNLDMNGFSITSAPSVDINMSAGGKIIMSCSDFEVGINANGTISIGDANGVGNGGLLTYDDATSIWNMAANNGDATISAGNAGIVKCYGSLNKVEIGDVNSTSNNTRLQIDDGATAQVRVQASQAMAYETPTLTNSFVENLEQIPCNTTIPMVEFTQFSSPINTSTTLCGSSNTFNWVFSGNRNGSSKYTEADRVEISVNAFIRGCDHACAWWIDLENTTTTTTLKGDNFEANTPFLTRHINNPTTSSEDTVLNFTTTFRNTKSVFTDGDTVRVNLYGYASNSVGSADFSVSIVLQPLRGWV